MRKLKVLERLFYRPLLDEERSHMPREMVERLFPNLEEVSEESPVTDEFLKLGDFLVVVQLIRRPTTTKQKKCCQSQVISLIRVLHPLYWVVFPIHR